MQKKLHGFTPYLTPHRLSKIIYCFAITPRRMINMLWVWEFTVSFRQERLTNKLVPVTTQREPLTLICRWLQFTSGVECTVSSSSSSESTARVGLYHLTRYDSSVCQNITQKKQDKKALLHPTTRPAVPTYGACTPGGSMTKIPWQQLKRQQTSISDHFGRDYQLNPYVK